MLTQKGKFRQKKNEDFMGLLLRLRGLGIEDKALLDTIEATPRDRFVPVQYIDKPYSQRSLPMECGQSMTGVDQIVRTVHALDLSKKQAVLEIGTGTGYQSALVSRLAKKVLSLDRFRTLVEQAQQRFENAGLDNIIVQQRDGLDDLAGLGLFDRIVANAVFPSQPKQYLDHIASGGSMITAIGERDSEQMLVRLTKVGSRFDRQNLFPVRMAPLRRGLTQYL